MKIALRTPGRPFIRKSEQIESLEPPVVEDTPCLRKVLKTIELLKAKSGDEAPIIGVVMAPFSLPVMQMGFAAYLELMHFQRELFWELMRINEAFCVAWANAQLKAGATAVVYFDPVSSTTITPKEVYLETGFKIAKRTLAQIEGPTATHSAAGRYMSIVDEVAETGTSVIGTSVLEDLSEMKAACGDRLTVLGNLNGIEMARWSSEEAETAVKNAIAKGGPGGRIHSV